MATCPFFVISFSVLDRQINLIPMVEDTLSFWFVTAFAELEKNSTYLECATFQKGTCTSSLVYICQDFGCRDGSQT